MKCAKVLLVGVFAAAAMTMSAFAFNVQGGTVDGYGDHRMVMSWAIAALDAREPVTVRGAEAVNKSYPEFFEIYTRLGGRCDVLNSDG